jgi:hypothetical protein
MLRARVTGTDLVLEHVLDAKQLAGNLALNPFESSSGVLGSAVDRRDDLTNFDSSLLERLLIEL